MSSFVIDPDVNPSHCVFLNFKDLEDYVSSQQGPDSGI